MKMTVEINNITKSPVEAEFVRRVAEKTFDLAGWKNIGKKNFSLSVAVVSETEIKNLNRIYRRKNQATDILSFAEYESTKGLRAEKSQNIFLGELVLCYNDIRKYALEKKIDISEELAKTISHGVLHLLGFRHGKKMFDIQISAAKNYRKKNGQA